jgi:hypothetical protein
MAVVEANLTGDAKSADNTMAVLAKITTYSKNSDAKKPEELKKIYDAIEKEKNRNMRTDDQATSLVDVMEKGNVQDYSGTLFLSVALVKNPNMTNRSKDVILIEKGRLRLGEIRGQNIQVLDSVTKGTVVRDEGTLEDLQKSDAKRLVQVDLFLIHEALKSYAADPKAWALNVEKASNKTLDLKIDDKKVITNSDKVDKAQLNQSEILIGSPRSLSSNDLEVEEVAPKAPADKPASPDPAAQTPVVKPAAGNIISTSGAAATKSNYTGVNYGSDCLPIATFQNRVGENKAKNLLDLFSRYSLNDKRELKGDLTVPTVMLRLENLNVADVVAKDADLDKPLKDALKQMASDTKSQMVLTLVRLDNGQTVGRIKTYEKDTQKELNPVGSDLVLKPAVLDYLKAGAKNAKASEDKALYVEMTNSCS